MTERFPKLKELGVTVLTRIKGESKWYYRNWNPSGNDGKGEYKFQTELTTKEAMDKGLPVDKIGSHGSYIKSYIFLFRYYFRGLRAFLTYLFFKFYSSSFFHLASSAFQGKKNATKKGC